jgi:CBS domain containing-hemolysin-like protein
MVMAMLREEQHSRYPVYEEDRDHLIGVLHIKDLARYLQTHGVAAEERFTLRALIRPVIFVPETLSLEQMLERFRQEHVQVAVVVDEFGGTAGLVTLEDLVEQIIGEIQDESDMEILPFSEIGPRTLRVRGDLLLDELNQHFALKLDSPEVDTVGGLIITELGHLAQPGESVTYHHVRFTVESIEGLAVTTVILTLPEAPETHAGNGDQESTTTASPRHTPAK